MLSVFYICQKELPCVGSSFEMAVDRDSLIPGKSGVFYTSRYPFSTSNVFFTPSLWLRS